MICGKINKVREIIGNFLECLRLENATGLIQRSEKG